MKHQIIIYTIKKTGYCYGSIRLIICYFLSFVYFRSDNVKFNKIKLFTCAFLILFYNVSQIRTFIQFFLLIMKVTTTFNTNRIFFYL